MELSGETVPGRCRGGRTAGGMSCQVSTAMRAPRVLLQLTDNTSEPRRTGMLFLGDWGEQHHDLCLLDEVGQVLVTQRIADGLAGVGELHALVAAHAEDPAQVAVGRDRPGPAGRAAAGGRLPGLCGQPQGRQPLPRPACPAQRPAGVLSGGRGGARPQLAEPEALAVLELAPTPGQGRRLTRAAIRAALVGTGRRRNLQAQVVAVLRCANAQGAGLEQQLTSQFSAHPDAAIVRSQPGLGWCWGPGCWAVRRRPGPRCHRQGPQGLRRHRPGHQVLGAADRGGSGGVQPAAGGCLLSVGVCGAVGLAGRPALR
jgi:hypothetical protein